MQAYVEICIMNNETNKANMQNQTNYGSFPYAQYQDEILSPEDFDFSDYEDSEYDSLEDK